MTGGEIWHGVRWKMSHTIQPLSRMSATGLENVAVGERYEQTSCATEAPHVLWAPMQNQYNYTKSSVDDGCWTHKQLQRMMWWWYKCSHGAHVHA